MKGQAIDGKLLLDLGKQALYAAYTLATRIIDLKTDYTIVDYPDHYKEYLYSLVIN